MDRQPGKSREPDVWEVALDLIVTLIAIRAVWKFLQGVMKGMSGGERHGNQTRDPGAPAQGVHMERDPVCGTFVVPDRELSLRAGGEHVYFCSAACRDKYRAKTA